MREKGYTPGGRDWNALAWRVHAEQFAGHETSYLWIGIRPAVVTSLDGDRRGKDGVSQVWSRRIASSRLSDREQAMELVVACRFHGFTPFSEMWTHGLARECAAMLSSTTATSAARVASTDGATVTVRSTSAGPRRSTWVAHLAETLT